MANGKRLDENIADSKDQEQVLKGIQPRHQNCFKFFKICRFLSIFALVMGVIAFILTKVPVFKFITATSFYRKYIFGGMLILAAIIGLLAVLTRVLFLRKAPFDDWVWDIASNRLGTDVIFYDSRYIYLSYDRKGKEVDKKDFVTEMSDKSIHYSYFYVKTDIDAGYIVVECKKRAPIPTKASLNADDDKFWNIIPLGLTIHPIRQTIAPIGWYLNDQNVNDELLETIPSVSILIAGGTGCMEKNTPVVMHDSIIK